MPEKKIDVSAKSPRPLRIQPKDKFLLHLSKIMGQNTAEETNMSDYVFKQCPTEKHLLIKLCISTQIRNNRLHLLSLNVYHHREIEHQLHEQNDLCTFYVEQISPDREN